MNILLTNDDGYFAKGILTLAKALKDVGHNVYVSAPKAEQSAKSHALSLRGSVRCEEIDLNKFTDGDIKDIPCLSIDGFPADCVNYAILKGFKDVKFDVCISGVNTCMNVGSDCIYSGTFSAACEASLLGVPGIAISAKMKGSEDYSFPVSFLLERLDQLIKYAKLFTPLNINIPSWNPENIKGAVVTKTGWRAYNDSYRENEDGSFTCGGKPINQAETDHDDDCAWVDRGYIAIVPVPAYATDMETLAEMKKDIWK